MIVRSFRLDAFSQRLLPPLPCGDAEIRIPIKIHDQTLVVTPVGGGGVITLNFAPGGLAVLRDKTLAGIAGNTDLKSEPNSNEAATVIDLTGDEASNDGESEGKETGATGDSNSDDDSTTVDGIALPGNEYYHEDADDGTDSSYEDATGCNLTQEIFF